MRRGEAAEAGWQAENLGGIVCTYMKGALGLAECTTGDDLTDPPDAG